MLILISVKVSGAEIMEYVSPGTSGKVQEQKANEYSSFYYIFYLGSYQKESILRVDNPTSTEVIKSIEGIIIYAKLTLKSTITQHHLQGTGFVDMSDSRNLATKFHKAYDSRHRP